METMAERVVLITGGAGFIGSHAVDRLINDGYQVIVFDNLSTGRLENVAQHLANRRFFFVEADVSDGMFAPMMQFLGKTGPIHTIIHLAAQTSVLRSVGCPLNDARINYIGNLQVFEFARLVDVKKVVFISSSAIYGNPASVPTREDGPAMPVSPYGVHKLAGEYAMQYYSRVHGISCTALRLFNVYGPRQEPQSPYSGVVSRFCRQVLSNAPLTIFGNGMQTRDFVHVSDVVELIVAAMRCDGTVDGVFNGGTGIASTINDVAEIVRAACYSRSDVRYAPPRVGEIAHSCADVSAARHTLHYDPQVTIETGLAETVAWFAANPR
jgi:UDP-glucose 4-epimerase